MTNTFWEEFQEKPHFDTLTKNIECDTLIIGGGIAGLLTAYVLKERGVDVVVLEKNEICSGITSKTTAVISAQHDTTYSEIIEKRGKSVAKAYLDANLEAVKQYIELSNTIDCDLDIIPSCMFSRSCDMKEEQRALSSLGYECLHTTNTDLPFDVRGAIVYPDMAAFNPLKFLYAISKDLKIYEHTEVKDIEENYALANNFKVKFKHAVVATHFPFINRTGLFFAKMYQVRSCVAAYEGAVPKLKWTYVAENEGGFYFRNYKDLLLVGAGDHRTGTKTDGFEKISDFCKTYYPMSKEKFVWANQDCVTLDGLPYVGRYGSFENVYVTTGFNLWGMTNSLAAANILADKITGRKNKYEIAYDPARSMFCMQLFANLAVTTLNLILPIPKRCPHMGCALFYNNKEHSWDCKCHGSRFSESGKLLDNPAKRDL